MIHITLPDGSLREYDQPLSIHEMAASISPGLARAAVAGRVNGVQVDCDFMLEQDARVSIITPREPEGLEIVRRSCALLLAMAVKQVYPRAQLLAGSALGDGFFYEFAYDRAFTATDLLLIEARMHQLAATNHTIRRRELPWKKVLAFFIALGEHYKAELIRALPEDDCLWLYSLGNFEDLCHGPHIPSTAILQAFRLAHITRNGAPLQRIYGGCWESQQELDAWLAPQQAVVVNLDERQADYAQSVVDELRRAGVRVNGDLRKEKISHKIRHHREHGVPCLLVIGDKEMSGGFVSARTCTGEDLGEMKVGQIAEWLNAQVHLNA
ncbi:His/Gly/Thr/Pro-type tRNA ligase C-terminal domain-containing protein [Pseudomonas purpurea]|uniref:His/Gly/Thr/Pro-type tRNA ligase C-terminal domain-containing protein n=1 Tax=Pseudomonas purpurea TaxID=3136737 RepID=UPI0032653256